MNYATKHRPTSLSEVVGNSAIKKVIGEMIKTKSFTHVLFEGITGCVDSDTEFLTPCGWKKISDYSDDDLVMQYDLKTGNGSFIKPLSFIKQPATTLYHFHTKYGVDQCLSAIHNVLYLSNKGILRTESFSDILKTHLNNKYGFSGRFLTSFSVIGMPGINLSDAELRVMVMVIADSYIPPNRSKCCVSVKKLRKIVRAQKLLDEAGINYRILHNCGYTRFYFKPPLRIKEFDSSFYACTKEQLSVIASESLFWDGNMKNEFFSTSKISADFIQYAFSASGFRASISVDNRINKPITYTVIKSNNIAISVINPNLQNHKCNITEVSSRDGYQYCFTVPTSYLILRRENNIFITGNSGKTTLAYILAKAFVSDENNITDVNCVYLSGVDDMRKKIDDLQKTSIFGKEKVLILDEIHRLSDQSQDVFLKPLEEGLPPNVLIIACTTTTEKLKPMLLDRFKRLRVKPLNDEESLLLISKIVGKEQLILDKWKRALLVEKSDGIPRRLISGLETIKDIEEKEEVIFLLDASSLGEENSDVLTLVKLLLSKADWGLVKKHLNILFKGGLSPESIRIGIANILAARLVSDYGTFDEKVLISDLYFNFLNRMVGIPEKSNLINLVFTISNKLRGIK